MTDPAKTSLTTLHDPLSGEVVGQASFSFSQEEREVIVDSVEAANADFPLPSLSAALKRTINKQFLKQYNSATAWPLHADEHLCTILEGAGFTRTGLFMRRSAWNEDGQIEFRPLGKSDLDDYLNAHAQKTAQKAAAFHGHDLEKVFVHVRQEYQERFSNGSCSDGETILYILDEAKHEKVGTLWTAFRQEGPDLVVFIEEIEIFETMRGKGYGSKALKALGNTSFGKSIEVVSLFVQPENKPAYALYNKLDFKPGRFEYIYTITSTQPEKCNRQPTGCG